ncbi:DUF1045 domain-containing protein, partial [Klebsiella pneumoniae]|nr:DUF1045 domain-containing protein [Klebsiella pneumoniae]
PALEDLAGCAVVDLDPLRAPLTAAEMARRRPEDLSERQRDHLLAYGYPYVLADFRFHMTLTGPLDAIDRPRALNSLAAA